MVLLVCPEVPMVRDRPGGMLWVTNASDCVGREGSMPTAQITDGKPPVIESIVVPDDEAQIRELAVKQIERKRRFYLRAFTAGAVAVFLVIIWAIAEYNNASGWPTNGFSQTSGIHDTWNSWIVYPIVAIALGVAIDAWNTYRRKPITESEIRREMNRLSGTH
jgi:2TM domain